MPELVTIEFYDVTASILLSFTFSLLASFHALAEDSSGDCVVQERNETS
jgi:hypothetical protein